MTVVLVHGNPETDAVGIRWWRSSAGMMWCGFPRRVSVHLCRTVGHVLEYRDGWSELTVRRSGRPGRARLGRWPRDQCGDASTRLVRSWASDIIGVFDPDYVWHELARVWQTPGDGEVLVETMMGGTVQHRADQLGGLGSPTTCHEDGCRRGPEMGRAILQLYRSARSRGWRSGPGVEKAGRPGFSLLASEDHMSARTRSELGCDEQEPARRCWRGWATGGWCRIRRGARPRSPVSGTRSTKESLRALRAVLKSAARGNRFTIATGSSLIGDLRLAGTYLWKPSVRGRTMLDDRCQFAAAG